MLELLQSFFADGLFIPHGHCYLWQPGLVWLHILSDSLVAIAYFSIPVTLLYFVHKREDFPFKGLLFLFGAFIVSCGTTHLMEIWTLWHPTYWLSGFMKAITAFISVYTAIMLVPIIPQALALPSPAQLEVANSQLKTEITERKLLEEALLKTQAELEIRVKELANTQVQLIQTEKMSSLGQLVAGVAHEINNPVNFIYGNINFANKYIQDIFKLVLLYQEYYYDPVPEIQAYITENDIDFIKEDLNQILLSIKIGAERIREIVLSLRNFSRLDEAEIKAVDIHDGINSTLLVLHSRLKVHGKYPDIQVIKKYSKLPKIECYPGQLNQVFLNILNNAIDALQESVNEPKIYISTEILDDDKLIVKIADNGCGMTEAVKQKIFDPFFTTKPVGSATGLGMSISYQIIQKHGGKLHCISSPLEGTEFVIQIPTKMKF